MRKLRPYVLWAVILLIAGYVLKRNFGSNSTHPATKVSAKPPNNSISETISNDANTVQGRRKSDTRYINPPGPNRLPAERPTEFDASRMTRQEGKYGIFGYAYPKELELNTANTIHAYISIKYPASKVRDTLMTIVLADDPTSTKDTVKLLEHIRLYKYVTVTLTAMDSSIIVHDIHPLARQELDTLEGNQWSWAVLVKNADLRVSRLKLKLVTENPVHYEERTIPINLKVEHNFFRKTYNYLMANPKVLVGSILIPLISFLGLRIFKIKKEAKPGKS